MPDDGCRLRPKRVAQYVIIRQCSSIVVTECLFSPFLFVTRKDVVVLTTVLLDFLKDMLLSKTLKKINSEKTASYFRFKADS